MRMAAFPRILACSPRQARGESRRAAECLAALQHRPCLQVLDFTGMFASNNSFKPNPLRSCNAPYGLSSGSA